MGILLQFRLIDDNHETITGRRATILDYSSKVHFLVLLQMTNTSYDEMGEFVTSDTDDEQLTNASLEIEGNESFLSTDANILQVEVYVSSDFSEIGHGADGSAISIDNQRGSHRTWPIENIIKECLDKSNK